MPLLGLGVGSRTGLLHGVRRGCHHESLILFPRPGHLQVAWIMEGAVSVKAGEDPQPDDIPCGAPDPLGCHKICQVVDGLEGGACDAAAHRQPAQLFHEGVIGIQPMEGALEGDVRGHDGVVVAIQ